MSDVTPVADPAPANPAPAPATPEVSNHWLPSKVYDTLKFLAQILLPAAGTLYFALAPVWHFPRAGDVVGTITAVDAFLGGFLTISKAQFLASDSPYDGDIHAIQGADGGKTYRMSLNLDPAQLEAKDQVTFKVIPS